MSDPVHWCSATATCPGGRNDTGDWSAVTCPACIRSRPGISISVPDTNTQEQLDRGEFHATIHIHPNAIEENLVRVISDQIARVTELALVSTMLDFHEKEGRWPEFVWMADWRRGLDMGQVDAFDLASIKAPEVFCGNLVPEDAGRYYSTGGLNTDPDVAAKFMAGAVAMLRSPDDA